MPLAVGDEKRLQTAAGYVELGMFLDANSELEKIDPLNRAAPEVLALRMEIYRGLKKWELMREIAKRLHEFQPDEIQWIISYAFASRRALSVEVAKEILLKSVAKFSKEAVMYFNLACYDCQLNLLDSAWDYLSRAFEIDSKWKLAALEDEDLKLLWDSM